MNAGHVRHLFFTLNIWLCLTSMMMVSLTALALEIPIGTIGIGVALPPLLFYFIYVEDRRSISPEDRTNHPYRTQLIERYRFGLGLSEAAALVGYEIGLMYLVFSEAAIGFEGILLGQLPLVVLGGYDRLKSRPGLDSLAVGGTWAFVIVFVVLVSTGAAVTTEVGAVFLAWGLIGIAGVESRNIEDVKGDSYVDRTTLAGHLGQRRSIVLVGVLKAMGVVVFWQTAGTFVAGLVVGYLLLLRVFRVLTRRERSRVDRRSTGAGEPGAVAR